VFLNGSTSSGKSSIARELQNKLPEPYLHFGVDDVLQRAPLRWHGQPEGFLFTPLPDGRMPLQIGPTGHSLLRAWRRMLRTAVEEGQRLILDEVLLEPDMLADWLAVFAGRDVFFVGVHCALPELQRREIARGDRGVGQALSMHDIVHQHGLYDLEVDTTTTSPAVCAEAIVSAIASRARPTAFDRLRNDGV
jgi:chloramphenicol 3-O phosphotransferase